MTGEHGPGGCDCRDRFASGDELAAQALAERRLLRCEVVADLRDKGLTMREIGEHLGISAMEVSRLLREVPVAGTERAQSVEPRLGGP